MTKEKFQVIQGRYGWQSSDQCHEFILDVKDSEAEATALAFCIPSDLTSSIYRYVRKIYTNKD